MAVTRRLSNEIHPWLLNGDLRLFLVSLDVAVKRPLRAGTALCPSVPGAALRRNRPRRSPPSFCPSLARFCTCPRAIIHVSISAVLVTVLVITFL